MLEVIESYIDISKASHETFNEHYAMYMIRGLVIDRMNSYILKALVKL